MRTELKWDRVRAGKHLTYIKRSKVTIEKQPNKQWKVFKNDKPVIGLTPGGMFDTLIEAKEAVHFCMQP